MVCGMTAGQLASLTAFLLFTSNFSLFTAFFASFPACPASFLLPMAYHL
jgi:hypothetical protein